MTIVKNEPHPYPAEPLTRVDLDFEATCSNPDCRAEHPAAELKPGCHPTSALWVAYRDGVLGVNCGTCHQPVARIAVAPGVKH